MSDRDAGGDEKSRRPPPRVGSGERIFFARSFAVAASERAFAGRFGARSIHDEGRTLRFAECFFAAMTKSWKAALQLAFLAFCKTKIDVGKWTSIHLSGFDEAILRGGREGAGEGYFGASAVTWELLVSPQKFVDTRERQ